MNKILKIKDIMSVNVVSFSVDTLVHEIVSTMQEKRISSVVIVDGKKPLGIITERDIVKALLLPEKMLQMSVTQLMSSPVKTMPFSADYRDAYMQMNEQKIRHIVVTDNEGKFVGILSESNFLNHLSPDQLLAIKEVSKVMTKAVFTCKPDDTLRSVLKQMVDRKIGGIVVKKNNKAVGIISERDALKFIQESTALLNQAVSTCMSAPVSTIHEKQTVLNAQTLMDNLGIRRLVVVDNNDEIAGIVSRHDLIKHIPEYYVELLREMIHHQKNLVSSTQAKLDEKIIFQNAVKSLPHTLVLMTQSEGIIQFVNIQEKGFCTIPTINIGDSLNDLESNFFELIQNNSWKDKVINGETLHKIIKVKNQTTHSCYLHTSISAIFDEKNRFEGYLYIARDISQEQTLEHELKRLTEQLREAYKIASIGHWELDAKTFKAFWSDEICDIIGMKKETIGGLEILKTLVKEKDFEAIENFLISALQTGSKHEMIYEIFPKNTNTSRWVECRARRELNEDGTPKCLIGTLQDVTNIKQQAIKEETLNNKLANATKLAQVGIWEWDAINDVATWNDMTYDIFGIKKGSKINVDLIESLIHKDDVQLHRDVIRKCFKDHLEMNFEYRIIKSNEIRVIHAIGNPTLKDGKVVGLSGAVQDITDLRKEEYQLKEAQRIAKLGSWEQNFLDHTLTWSDEAYRIFEIDVTKEMTFDDFMGRVHPQDRNSVNDAFQASVDEHKTYHLVHRLLFSDGRIKYVSEEAQHFYDANDNHIHSIGTVQDITGLKETEAQLDFLAHHDHLTELPNRVLLNARLKHTLSAAKRDESMTAVMFMDIDNFKNINDSYGHTFGDELLVAVSHRLKSIMREDDTFARIGGDEFVVVMSHFRTLEQITHISQKIMEQFEKVFTVGEKEFWISVSIGICIAPDDGNNSEILIKNADTAMYEAKGDGKNTVRFYNDKMSASSFERVVFENALKTAIKNKEFEVYYQPQEDLQDNSIIGFEALVRWKHPTLGLVPPDKFISIAEETKMILDIGAFVLEQSCKDIKQWHDEGLCKGRIAVNVSGVQLEYSEFAEILKHNFKEYGIDSSMIEIEVTESMVMKNPDRWINILEEIHRIGVSISIDDFGTGYSSLSYLRRLPVDTLKIDQSFVQDIPDEKDACAIVDAIINMADSLGLNTLAEGIETIAQREYLVEQSCKHAQGYLLSKPMNGKDAYSWLKAKHLKK